MGILGPLLLSAVVIALSSPYLVRAGRRIERSAPPPVVRQVTRSRSAASRGIRSARQATVPRILASAAAQDWTARRQAARTAAPAARANARPATGATVTDLSKRHRPAAAAARRMPPPPEPSKPARKPAERKPDVTTPGTGASADLFAALGVLLGHARSGGLRPKQRTMLSVAEALDYMSAQLASFAVLLSEPDQHYPPAVWEQVQRAAAHLKAASSCTGDSASALSALITTTLGEAGANAPHHRELIDS